MEENKLAVFERKRIRKTIYNNEWWFSIIDVIEVLTDSSIPKRYWSDLKRKLVTEGYSQLYEKIVQLKSEKSRLRHSLDVSYGSAIRHGAKSLLIF